MNRIDVINSIKAFKPFNEQEEYDKKEILDFLEHNDDAFLRTNLRAHMTASAWVLNHKHDKLLMAYHNLYNSWAWLGGHADGDEDLLEVAIKEVKEESGVVNVRPVSRDIFSLEILTVDGHEKKGHYVPCHLHMNVTYLLEADDSDPVFAKADENSAVGWFGLEEAIHMSNEEWFKERIYRKLNSKLRVDNYI